MLEYRDNTIEKKKSLMLAQLPLCNGAQTGHQCNSYWPAIYLMGESQNPEALRSGDKKRLCMLASSMDGHPFAFLGEEGCEMAVKCAMYKADKKRPYDKSFEEFNPMTEDEIEKLKILGPSTPVVAKSDGGFWRRMFQSAATTVKVVAKAAVLDASPPTVVATLDPPLTHAELDTVLNMHKDERRRWKEQLVSLQEQAVKAEERANRIIVEAREHSKTLAMAAAEQVALQVAAKVAEAADVSAARIAELEKMVAELTTNTNGANP